MQITDFMNRLLEFAMRIHEDFLKIWVKQPEKALWRAKYATIAGIDVVWGGAI